MLILSLIAFRGADEGLRRYRRGTEEQCAGGGGLCRHCPLLSGGIRFREPGLLGGHAGPDFSGNDVRLCFSFPRFRAGTGDDGFSALFMRLCCLPLFSLTRNLPNGIYMVWMIFISSWICDTCAYRQVWLSGKHKLAPCSVPRNPLKGPWAVS